MAYTGYNPKGGNGINPEPADTANNASKNYNPEDPVLNAYAKSYYKNKKREKTGKSEVAKAVKTEGVSKGVKSDSTPKINKSKPTKKEAPKTKREVKREDRKNERKAKRNARLDKKIARQTKEGIEAGDGAEKGINSRALEKKRRVDKLKARKDKNNKR